VLLGSIYLRDALVDSGPIVRDYYRGEIRQIGSEIEQLLPAHLLEVEVPVERSTGTTCSSSWRATGTRSISSSPPTCRAAARRRPPC
jgi:hypothetical protein